jgi:hypothetical protein
VAIRSLWPELSADGIEERVSEGSDPIYHIPENEPYVDKLGTGRLFLPRALAQAPSSAPAGARALPGQIVLACPNPSAGPVRFTLPSAASGDIRLSIFEPTGRLVHESRSSAGRAEWDGRDRRGIPAASRYYARIEVGARNTLHSAGDPRRVLKNRRGRVRSAGRPDARRDDEGVVDALRRGGATPQAAGRRSNPKGWRHLRRRSALLVVRDAPVASPSSSRLDRLASAASAAAWVFQHPASPRGPAGRGASAPPAATALR